MNPSTAELDWIPIKDIPKQYGISRTAFYNRLTALKIEPMKRGTKSYVNSRQLALLNELHHYMQSGGTMTDFLEMRGLSGEQTVEWKIERPNEREPNITQNLFNGQFGNSMALASVAQEIPQTMPVALISVDALKALMNQTSSFELISYLEKLEKCCEYSWILSTSELSQLLGLSAKTIARYGESFQDSGFVFSRQGRKRSEIAWRVSKPDL